MLEQPFYCLLLHRKDHRIFAMPPFTADIINFQQHIANNNEGMHVVYTLAIFILFDRTL